MGIYTNSLSWKYLLSTGNKNRFWLLGNMLEQLDKMYIDIVFALSPKPSFNVLP